MAIDDLLLGGSESESKSTQKSKSTSQSQGTQDSYGYDQSASLGQGTSQQTSQSQGSSFGMNTGSSFGASAGTSVDMTPEAFKNLQPGLAGTLGTLSGTASNPFGGIQTFSEATGSPLTAGAGGNEMAVLDALMSEGAGRRNLLDQTLSGQFTDPNSNPFLSQYIEAAQRPTLQGLQETLERALPGLFTRGGQFVQYDENGEGGSSAFQRAAAIASRGAADALGDIATKIGFQAYDAERGRQQQAVGLGQQEAQTMVNNLQAQALPRLIEQMGIDKGMEEYNKRITAVLEALKLAGMVTQPTLGQQSASVQGSEQFGIQGSQQTAESQGSSQQTQQSFSQGEQASTGQQTAKSKSKSEGTATSSSDSSTGLLPTLVSPFRIER